MWSKLISAPPFFFFFWPGQAACGILVLRPGIEPGPPEVKAQSSNHWTAREFPAAPFYSFLMWLLEKFLLYRRLTWFSIGRHSSKPSFSNLSSNWPQWPLGGAVQRLSVNCLNRHFLAPAPTPSTALCLLAGQQGVPSSLPQDSSPTSKPGNPFLLTAYLSPTLEARGILTATLTIVPLTQAHSKQSTSVG